MDRSNSTEAPHSPRGCGGHSGLGRKYLAGTEALERIYKTWNAVDRLQKTRQPSPATIPYSIYSFYPISTEAADQMSFTNPSWPPRRVVPLPAWTVAHPWVRQPNQAAPTPAPRTSHFFRPRKRRAYRIHRTRSTGSSVPRR